MLAPLGLLGALLVGGPTATWDDVLGHLGLTADTAQLPLDRWRGGEGHPLAVFDRMWDDWRLIEPTATSFSDALLSSEGRFGPLLSAAGERIGTVGPRQDTAVTPVAEAPADALADAIAAVYEAAGQPLAEERLAAIREDALSVPAGVAQAASAILRAVPQAVEQRNKVLGPFEQQVTLAGALQAARDLAVSLMVTDSLLAFMDQIDLPALVSGGLPLAEALDRTRDLSDDDVAEQFRFAADTPLGRIELNGGGDDTYGPGSYLLIIDTSGNDRYAGGAATSGASGPVSVLVDLAGDDHYECTDAPAFGAGVMGYALLLDASGNDVYHCEDIGLGAGAFGVGILVDRRGGDRYDAHLVGEGAAAYGVGVLCDLAGADRYYCLSQSQGYAGTQGCGALVDATGDDTYEADDTNIVNPSPQTAEHNVSMAQGAAFGRRAHPGDGYSLAGGIGILADGEGNDSYRCGVFGQGVGYWYGAGLLVDSRGNDSYQGVWYVQGSSAHYAIGALCDLSGDDSYKATATQSEGQGHDYSLGWLHDVSGNDRYDCASGGLGVGMWNGIGIMWDEAGDDTYEAGGGCLASVGDSRPEHPCLGVFLDTGGSDVFPEGAPAKPHTVWVLPPVGGHPLARAVGVSE